MAARQIRGPIQSARTTVPKPAEPTHHHAATPSRYPKLAACTVEPAPMLAASRVASRSPGPSVRPATKKSAVPATRRPIASPTAEISAT